MWGKCRFDDSQPAGRTNIKKRVPVSTHLRVCLLLIILSSPTPPKEWLAIVNRVQQLAAALRDHPNREYKKRSLGRERVFGRSVCGNQRGE